MREIKQYLLDGKWHWVLEAKSSKYMYSIIYGLCSLLHTVMVRVLNLITD